MSTKARILPSSPPCGQRGKTPSMSEALPNCACSCSALRISATQFTVSFYGTKLTGHYVSLHFNKAELELSSLTLETAAGRNNSLRLWCTFSHRSTPSWASEIAQLSWRWIIIDAPVCEKSRKDKVSRHCYKWWPSSPLSVSVTVPGVGGA